MSVTCNDELPMFNELIDSGSCGSFSGVTWGNMLYDPSTGHVFNDHGQFIGMGGFIDGVFVLNPKQNLNTDELQCPTDPK